MVVAALALWCPACSSSSIGCGHGRRVSGRRTKAEFHLVFACYLEDVVEVPVMVVLVMMKRFRAGRLAKTRSVASGGGGAGDEDRVLKKLRAAS